MEWIDLPDPRDPQEYPETVPGTGWLLRNLYRRRTPVPVEKETDSKPKPTAKVDPSPEPPTRSQPESRPKPEPPTPPPKTSPPVDTGSDRARTDETPKSRVPSSPVTPSIPSMPRVPVESKPNSNTPSDPLGESVSPRAPSVVDVPKRDPIPVPQVTPISILEPPVTTTSNASKDPEPEEDPLEKRATDALERYRNVKQRLDAVSLRQLGPLTLDVELDVEGLSDNPEYQAVWHENILRDVPVWLEAAEEVERLQAARVVLQSDLRGETKSLAELRFVIEANPNDRQRTWISSQDLQLLENARAALSSPFTERSKRADILNKQLGAFEGIEGVPRESDTRKAVKVHEAYEKAAPVAVDADQLREATRVARAVSPEGIRKAIAQLAKEANEDPSRKLVLDNTQLMQLQDTGETKKKDEVIQDIAKRVEDQHIPGVASWRRFLRLEQNATNLYLGPHAGYVDGYNTHVSLFKDTIGRVADTDVTKYALSDLQDLVLGSGVTGYHVTLEQAEPGSPKNPSAYRGLPDALEKQFEVKFGKAPWDPTVKQGLEKIRDDKVTAAEGVVKTIQDRKGAPPEKQQAKID